MPKQIPDEDQPEQDSKSARLAQDITDLHKEIRQDFDQRITDLASLMNRFRSLMNLNESRSRTSNTALANKHNTVITRIVPLPKDAQSTSSALSGNDSGETQTPPLAATSHSQALNQAAPRARFETGLYQLNSQLQRFRLELDQELEFRQEPLHVHFRQHSDLARILQQISLNMHKP